MREIVLTQGKVALVDDADYESLMHYKWYARCTARVWYAARMDGTSTVFMHDAICLPRQGMEVDHRDRDGLNNQRYNLRPCVHRQNCANASKRVGTVSSFKGVTWEPRKRLWRARIRARGVLYSLGRYKNEIDAAKAYNEAALQMFGEFANPNELDRSSIA